MNLQNEALTLPSGTQFPGSPQGLLNLVAQYLAITGGDDFDGINTGSVEPAPEDRDKPWWKTDDSGNIIGWFGWGGSAWTSAPIVLARGTTAQRPSSAVAGQLYEDTTIGVVIRYTGAAWITNDGSPGDIKEVKAASLADALERNPGWSWDSESEGEVIIGASDGTGDWPYGEASGEEEHTIELDELPNDAVSLQSGWGIFPGQFQNGSQAPGIAPIVSGLAAGSTQTTGPINPSTQVAFSLRQPSRAYFRLVKDE